MSPSCRRCTGRTARAMPSCAVPASFCACALVRSASVATTASVVLSGAGAFPAAASARRRRAASCTRASGYSTRPRNNSPYSTPVSGSSTDPAAFATTSAATVIPEPSTVLAVPTPPLEQPGDGARAGADAPLRHPRTRRVGRRGLHRRASRRGVRTRAEVPAAPQVEDARGRHHRHDMRRVRPHRHPAPLLLQPGHHPGGRVEPVGAASGQHDRVDLLHHVARVERVGLLGAGAAAAHVHGGDSAALGREDDRGAGRASRRRCGWRAPPAARRRPSMRQLSWTPVWPSRGPRRRSQPAGAAASAARCRAAVRAVRVTPVATAAADTRPAASTAHSPRKVQQITSRAVTGRTSCWARPTSKWRGVQYPHGQQVQRGRQGDGGRGGQRGDAGLTHRLLHGHLQAGADRRRRGEDQIVAGSPRGTPARWSADDRGWAPRSRSTTRRRRSQPARRDGQQLAQRLVPRPRPTSRPRWPRRSSRRGR